MPRIYHVYAQVGGDIESQRRMRVASHTWRREQLSYGDWQELRVTPGMLERDATNLGETIQLPYIHDMMDIAFIGSKSKNDILLISNADTCMVPGLAEELADRCRYGNDSCYCHRWDLMEVADDMDRKFVCKHGSWYVGADLFAVTANWWQANANELPPFVLGRECWDWAFRVLINRTGGDEIQTGIYHEKHVSDWENNMMLPGNLYNRGLMRRFLERNKLPMDYIEGKPYLPVTWP